MASELNKKEGRNEYDAMKNLDVNYTPVFPKRSLCNSVNDNSPKRKMFIAPFSFKGRIECVEYFYSFVLVFIINLVGGFAQIVLSNYIVETAIIILYVFGLYFLIAQGTKRCHDFGRSGLWQIIPFCYGLFCTIGGNKCRNQYGLPPTTKKDLSRIVDNIEDIVDDFSFKGRSDRGKYLMSLFLCVVYATYLGWNILFNVMAIFIFSMPLLTNFDLLSDRDLNSSVLDIFLYSHLLVYSFIILWIFFANGAKRCHDLGKSGWWQLIPFYIFVMMFKKGEVGTNKYGVEP